MTQAVSDIDRLPNAATCQIEEEFVSVTDRTELLRANAARCLQLARTSSDPEVAQALRELARDMELAISYFETVAADSAAK